MHLEVFTWPLENNQLLEHDLTSNMAVGPYARSKQFDVFFLGHVFKAPRHPTLRDPSWDIQGRPKIFTTETFHGVFIFTEPFESTELRFLDPWKVLIF